MNIVYEVLKKLNRLKPSELYNERILQYFLKTGFKDYFNDNDKFEITINLKNNYLEIINLNTNEEYLFEKKDNSLDFIQKKTNEILFHIRNNIDNISLIHKKAITIVKFKEDNEEYSIIDNNDGKIVTLSDLKIKISNKDYFELKTKNQKTKIIGLALNENKYEQIFSFLNKYIFDNKKERVRKRILNLF